jgi:hypothetical protein
MRICSTNGEKEKLGGKARRKKNKLGSRRCRWVDNTGIDLGEIE